MKRRWLRWIGFGVLSVVALVLCVVAWTVTTQSGARWLFGIARNVTDGALRVESVEGSVAGPLVLTSLSFNDAASGLRVAAQRVEIDLALRKLFGLQLHILNSQLSGLDVTLGTSEEPPPKEPQPFTLEAPIDIVVANFELRDATFRSNEETLLAIDRAQFSGHWVDTSVMVRQLDIHSPQGEVHFAGKVQDKDAYVGEGEGRFQWRSGERIFAGTLEGGAQGSDTHLELRLSSPLRAEVDIRLEQSDELPWNFVVLVPSFDPRDGLLPGSSLQSLAAELRGEGTLAQGVARGQISINGEPITFDRVAFEHAEELLRFDSLLLIGGGQFQTVGHVQMDADPAVMKVDAQWSDVELSEQWAGQLLRTKGAIAFAGSANAYTANGALSLGPPERLANIELRIEGSPERIEIAQFDIVQPDGRLAANGRVELQPVLAWELAANASTFDPGAFAPAWGGSLNFDLATEGRMPDSGPQATLVLEDLRGRLRGRSLSGHADISLDSNKVLAGVADLRSGESRLLLQAERGDAMDAVATIEVPSLNDWMPDAGGELRGRFSAQGTWPELTIAGEARGRSLHLGDLRAEALALNLDVTNPTQPDGSMRLEISDAAAAGMEFDSLKVNASGNPAAHALELDLRGSPLGSQFALTGSQQDAGWSGTMERLVLDVEDAARLTLQTPVKIVYSTTQSSISRACFADGEIRLCLAGDLQANGILHGNYSLQNVPIALANAFTAAESPIMFDGTIAGEGDVQRNAEGQFSGTASLRSARGHIARRLADSEQPEILLTFADFGLNAELDGDLARARIATRLNENGSLNAEVALVGLSQPETQVDGNLAARFPDLSVIELFAPQVANVQGRLDLSAAVRGTMQVPNVSGELNVSELAMDLPELGLQLKNGRVQVTPRSAKEFDLEGGIQSGDGALAFAGVVRTEGTSTVSINGKEFLAADMPGARVIIAPALVVERTVERVSITGDVRVPTATVNLQELPRDGGGQKASSDVVIIDAKTQQEADAEALPIYAEITVIMGDDVELSGFGLQAKVDGQLRVNERPGEPTTGSGEIRVDGRYKAYGQDLTIQEGRLLYASTPLDNPRLNLVATREVGEVTAGLRVSGYAQNPVLTVFSNPEMGQANALSYLVAGKPIDQIGAGDGEGDALQTAARSLGTAAGGLLAKTLGARLGVDEIGIKDDETIGGSAFTVGQYLSPRLYLSYGVGLFEPGEVITLRFKLSEAFAIQAKSGSEDSRAGIEYRIER